MVARQCRSRSPRSSRASMTAHRSPCRTSPASWRRWLVTSPARSGARSGRWPRPAPRTSWRPGSPGRATSAWRWIGASRRTSGWRPSALELTSAKVARFPPGRGGRRRRRGASPWGRMSTLAHSELAKGPECGPGGWEVQRHAPMREPVSEAWILAPTRGVAPYDPSAITDRITVPSITTGSPVTKSLTSSATNPAARRVDSSAPDSSAKIVTPNWLRFSSFATTR